MSRPVISGATIASTLVDQIRTDVLDGRLPPGMKLVIESLSERYSAGQTPIREALNRLTADGLVERREQRGFVVAEVSLDDLYEITRTRCWLEEIALRESIAAHTQSWEEAVVLAHHRLGKVPRSLDPQQFRDNPEWEPAHRAFHRALIAGCNSRWLILFCDQLADQHYRYRQLATQRSFPYRGELHEHQAIVDAALADDAATATTLLRQHYERTASVIAGDAKGLGPAAG